MREGPKSGLSVYVSLVDTSAAVSAGMFKAHVAMFSRSESFSWAFCFQIHLLQANLYISLLGVTVCRVSISVDAFLNDRLKQSQNEHSLWHVHKVFLLSFSVWKMEAVDMIFSLWSYAFHPKVHV